MAGALGISSAGKSSSATSVSTDGSLEDTASEGARGQSLSSVTSTVARSGHRQSPGRSNCWPHPGCRVTCSTWTVSQMVRDRESSRFPLTLPRGGEEPPPSVVASRVGRRCLTRLTSVWASVNLPDHPGSHFCHCGWQMCDRHRRAVGLREGRPCGDRAPLSPLVSVNMQTLGPCAIRSGTSPRARPPGGTSHQPQDPVSAGCPVNPTRPSATSFPKFLLSQGFNS